MLKKIKRFFKSLKQKWIIHKEFSKFASSQEDLSLGEQFAFKTFDTVNLLWNGKLLKFVIGNINALDLVFCGKYPNIYFTYLNSLLQAKGELNDENMKEVDIVKLQEEEAIFFEELCKKTMIKPTYEELYNGMLKVKKSIDASYNPTNIKEIFPFDFLTSLQTYHFNKLFNLVKKNEAG
ncbi:MAG: hypothetical protein ACTTIZ_01755 [Treponema sp.]